jgi:phosphoenolpyruvate-protein phosphotransferase (PTS system enzyme I)
MLIRGTGVSSGVVVGDVHRLRREGIGHAVPASAAQVLEALASVGGYLDRRADLTSMAAAQDVLRAQAMIAGDPALIEAIKARFVEDDTCEDVRPGIAAAFGGFRELLLAVGGYIAERVADLDEIRDRLIAAVAGVEWESIGLDKPAILIADDLTPADTAELDLRFALALVVAKGGPTSHTAIVARGLGIPAIVACPEAEHIDDGMTALVDGRDGVVIVSPTPADIAARSSREDLRRARSAAVSGPGLLADGRPIALLGNAGHVDDVVSASAAGAEGIGLLRTELLFLHRTEAPTLEEQVSVYSAALVAMTGRKVIVRTLDAGSDKPLPFLQASAEENPALGVRGWRLGRLDEITLEIQLDALAAAARATQTDPWVMAPMISTVSEAREFAQRARSKGLRHVGVMVETPSAALLAAEMLAEIDFASIGTNDLSQYVMAADRLDGRLGDLTTAWQPAVLRAVKMTLEAAVAHGKPVGVCGESAADPYMAAVLVGLGASSLSMAPSALGDVRATLSTVDHQACIRASHAALQAHSPEEARAAVVQLVDADA